MGPARNQYANRVQAQPAAAEGKRPARERSVSTRRRSVREMGAGSACLGITTVVDLRSKEEIERKPDPLAQEPGIRYLHCPLAGDGRVPAPDEVPLSYMEMADGTGQMAGALRAIAEAPQAVLFHCTAGKDRTGVVAALLLWLAGVSEEDILADYIVSGPYLQQMLRAYCEAHPGAVVCPPQSAYMSSFLRLFAQRYGTPQRYLEMLGIDAGKLAEKLRPKEL